jgi:hypothetical protein
MGYKGNDPERSPATIESVVAIFATLEEMIKTKEVMSRDLYDTIWSCPKSSKSMFSAG